MRLRRAMLGITLIEILIAMSILAILSVLGYKAFSNLLISRESLSDTSRQWVELARVFRRIESDLVRLPTAAGLAEARQLGAKPTPLVLTQGEAEGELALEVYSAGSPSGRETLRYRWNQTGLSWRIEHHHNAAAVLGPYRLFASGYGLRWRLMMQDGRYHESWPVPGAEREWPQALEMRVVMPDGTAVTRLWSMS